MPPRFYPQLRSEDDVKGRIRKGFVPLPALKQAVNGTAELEERVAIKVLYYCALRASELGLQPVKHFDATRGTLDIQRLKQSSARTYPLEPWVLDDLRAWMKARPLSPFLFPHPQDPSFPLDRHNVLRYWKRAALRAGLAKTLQHPHVLKHSIATHMLERGDDLVFVQEWLGHKSFASTQVYAEVVGKRMVKGQLVLKDLTKELT